MEKGAQAGLGAGQKSQATETLPIQNGSRTIRPVEAMHVMAVGGEPKSTRSEANPGTKTELSH